MSLLIRLLPKVGPLRPLKFKTPTGLSEKYFIQSFDTITTHFSMQLKNVKPGINLRDMDFDTGKPTAACEYSLADETYDAWLLKLDANKFEKITSAQKQNLMSFYDSRYESGNIKYTKNCRKVYNAFTELKKTSAVY